MALRCFFHHRLDVTFSSVELCASEGHHLLKVLRAKPKELVEVLDGQGGVAIGHLEATGSKQPVYVHLESFREAPKPAANITLVQALPLAKTFEEILKHGTALGVSTFQPLFTERSQCPKEVFEKTAKIERFQAILIEACKQSGNPFLPQLAPAISLNAWLPTISSDACKWVASLEEQAVPIPNISPRVTEIIATIGPEGDFSTAEYATLKQAGFNSIWLNPYTLRSEIAAITLLAQIQHGLKR